MCLRISPSLSSKVPCGSVESEMVISHLNEFDGKQLQDISKGELNEAIFSEEEETSSENAEQANDLAERLKALIGDSVADVRTTRRLIESPACLVYGDEDIDLQMRQIMEAAGQAVPVNKPILEINASHPLLQRLENTQDEQRSTELAALLYDQALLSAGEQLENPAMFIQRLNKLLFSSEATSEQTA